MCPRGKFPVVPQKGPNFKKGSRNSNDKYRPVSILSNISKLFETHLFKLMSSLIDKILSVYRCGVRKGFSAQHSLVATLEKWKFCNDKSKSFGALLTDLSKAFDRLS